MRIKKLLASASVATIVILSPVATPVASASVPSAAALAPAFEGKEGNVKLSHAAQECIHKLEAGEPIDNCQKAPNPILPTWSEMFWGTIAFILVFALLAKLALPAIRKSMSARSDKIEGDLASAAKVKGDAEAEAKAYTAKLGDSRAEGDRIVDDSRAQAELVRKDIIARAEAEAAEIRQRAADDAAAQSARLKHELEGHVKQLSLKLAEKIVGANLNDATNNALVDKYIVELSK